MIVKAQHPFPVSGRLAQRSLTSPIWLLWAAIALLPFALVSINTATVFASLLLVPVLVVLLWRPGEPPVLLFVFLVQWLQISISAFVAEMNGLTLEDFFGGLEMERAIRLSLAGLLMLALGVRAALSRQRQTVHPDDARAEIVNCSLTKLFCAYIVTFLAANVLGSVQFIVPQLTQIIVAALNVRWAFAFILAFAVLRRRERYDLLITMLLLEVIAGTYSYFSTFNRVFFLLVVVIPISAVRFNARRWLAVGAVGVTISLLSVGWSAIKPEYRAFLNQGGGQQEILVSARDALGKLSELVGDLDAERMARGVEALVRRVAYVEFFAVTLNHVPAVIAHQDGALWLGAVTHVFQPRLLFPNKPELDDSEQTRVFTGLKVAGAAEGTAISIGYFAESYIDFGSVGMMAPIFLLGAFYGAIYRLFVFHGSFRVIGFAVATSILLIGASNVGTSNVKLVGGNLMAVIVMWMLRDRLMVPLARWAGIRQQAAPKKSTAV